MYLRSEKTEEEKPRKKIQNKMPCELDKHRENGKSPFVIKLLCIFQIQEELHEKKSLFKFNNQQTSNRQNSLTTSKSTAYYLCVKSRETEKN